MNNSLASGLCHWREIWCHVLKYETSRKIRALEWWGRREEYTSGLGNIESKEFLRHPSARGVCPWRSGSRLEPWTGKLFPQRKIVTEAMAR